MKLLHLSDLHIGKRLNERSLLDEQAYILLQILNMVEDEKPQAVLICGDVYDKSVPSAEAVTLFDDFLCRLSKKQVPVLIISGNHDSPERLAFGNQLMTDAGIYISPVYDGQVRSLSLTDQQGEVVFWLLPFIKPAHVKRYFPDESIESYTDALRVAISHMDIDPQKRNVLLTHQFVTGAAMGGSEEFNVGGTDNVDASVFEGFDYVALGHIHGPQNIDSNRIRYCGTPLKYSLSEECHAKSVTMVELGVKGDLKLTLLPLQPKHELRSIRGTFAELCDTALSTEDYIYAFLTDEQEIPEAIGKLRVIYPNLMELRYDNTRTRTNQVLEGLENVEKKTPLQLFEEFYEAQNNQPMSDTQREFMHQLMEAAMEDSL